MKVLATELGALTPQILAHDGLFPLGDGTSCSLKAVGNLGDGRDYNHRLFPQLPGAGGGGRWGVLALLEGEGWVEREAWRRPLCIGVPGSKKAGRRLLGPPFKLLPQ